jgi:23S rRNA (uracil1939-C5)-methyltransferase/tRNA (uracil-5-)-methyltransferase
VPKKRKFNDVPFAYHQVVELDISTLTNRGVGLGRVPLPCETPGPEGQVRHPAAPDPASADRGGWVVMVPFTLPGERVRARVFRNHKNYSEADPVEVLTPSPHRVVPRCPLFGSCGGCQYQHLAYPEQLAWKRRQVSELLDHLAGVTFPVEPVVGSPREFGYRSKITPHFETTKGPGPEFRTGVQSSGPDSFPIAEFGTRVQNSGPDPFPIGFLRQGTRHDIVDVPRCEIATDRINDRLAGLRAIVRKKAAEGAYPRGATLLLREAGGVVATEYDSIITEEIGPPVGLKLRFLARDFFQNNPFILPEFVAHVRAQASADGARFLVDAYCGSGLFALGAARAFERVAGIEISGTSVAFARENAAANGIPNAVFLAGDAADIFAGLDFPPAGTAVVVDPPRRGCDESFLRQLFAFGPRTVVYVSCDPATQMRDLRLFLEAGYSLARVQPFDLFPQTRHLECVITLRR